MPLVTAGLPSPSFAAVVVAAGQGSRAGQPVPKQFAAWRGKPVVRHSVETLLAAGADPVFVAIPAGAEELAGGALADLPVRFVSGGETRRQSVAHALEALAADPPESVLIHDAARPDLPAAVIERLLAALDGAPGAIPVLPMVDSLVTAQDDRLGGALDRGSVRRVQTPQAFRFAAILTAHRDWPSATEASDDAQVLHAAGGAVALVAGDERLAKLTFAEDFAMHPGPAIRVGMGYDVHRLAAGEELWLGGVLIPHDKGLAGHSDADVALHALTDAILGALGQGDIGTHFPPSDDRWKGAASSAFLSHAASLAGEAGYRIAHADLTVICEAPKIGPHRAAMRAHIARLLDLAEGCVSIKATTTEGLGFAGRGEGIAAQAVATLERLG